MAQRKLLKKLILAVIIIGLFYQFQKIEEARASMQSENNLSDLYNNGDFSEAIKEYKRLMDKGEIEGYLNSAIIFKDLSDYHKAINTLNKAKSEFGNDLRILSFLGRLYYLNSQPDKAISILKKILEIKPDDSDTHINLGLCYEDKGDDIEAEKYFEKAVALNKNSVVAQLLLADLYCRQERLPSAIAKYQEVAILDPSIQRVNKYLAEVLLKMGNFGEALKVYNKISLIEPENNLITQRINEISVRLGREYFEKEKMKILTQRKQKMVLVKPVSPVKNIIFVRIGLIYGENLVEFKCSGPFDITTKDRKNIVMKGRKGENYIISRSNPKKIIITSPNKEAIIIGEPIMVKPSNSGTTITLFNVKFGKNNFWSTQQDRSYRGVMEVNVEGQGIKVINIVNLEEYLYSLLPSEMPANWPEEALKAQVIAARSEAIAKLDRHKDEGFDFCPEVHCQAYSGIERETPATNRAVDMTQGLIIEYKGQPIDAVYSCNCGGHTQDNIFAKAEAIPYLKGRPDSLEDHNMVFPLSPLDFESWLKEPVKGILCDIPEDSKKSNFRWIRSYTAEEIEDMLNKMHGLGRIDKIFVIKRQKSGHASAVKIIGSKCTYILEKELNIRKALGDLRSSMFKIEIKYGPDKRPKQFIFYGGGWGHGVGMCQSGAYGLANTGKNYHEILNHYFQEIELKKLY